LSAAEHRAPRRALLLLLLLLLQDKEKKADGFREIGGSKRRGVETETVGGEGIGRTAIVLKLKICSRCPQRAQPQTGATRCPLCDGG
jgi:hypothetical protein